MRRTPFRHLLAAVALLCLAVGLPAQITQQQLDLTRGAGTFPNFNIYKPREIGPADLSDSLRLEQMIRDGKIYLSLSDALAIALENNLDIAVARYGPLEADTDILRARSGQNLSGVQTQISTLSTQASAQGGGGGGGGQGAPGQATGIFSGAGDAAQAASGGDTGSASSFFGTQVTALDPVVSTSMFWTRQSNPQISNFVTGTNTLIQDFGSYQFNFSKGFTTGTTLNLGFTNFNQSTNNLRNNLNPTISSEMNLSIRQRLTQGFGRAINERQIRVANNNREVQDLQFKEQVITTVSRIQNLYWDLVSFLQEAEARRSDLALSEQLVRDNDRKVELGLLARIEVTRAKAEAVNFRRQLIQAENTVKQQQDIIKNALTKHGPASVTLANVEIVPTDQMVIPEVEPIQPLQDLISMALQSRPTLAQQRINLTNSDINLKGIRNAMLPSVDVTAFATNNGLAGSLNPDLIGSPDVPPPDPFFVGGFGSAVGQIFRRNFPDYGVSLQLNIPLKNRQAQADMTRELLRRRKADIQLRQTENAMKLDVTRALTNLQQARDTYEAAVEGRRLQEEMLESERKRFDLGSSTIFQIVQSQRDLATARTAEINAMRTYTNARVELDRITGQTLAKNNVSVEEAYVGRVSKQPDPPPPALLQESNQ
jgi:outer membrane protein TolC